MTKKILLNRRQILQLGLGSLAGIGTLALGRAKSWSKQISSLDNPNRKFTVIGTASLKERAADKGLFYGSAARNNPLSSDQTFIANFIQECGILVPEWDQKWTSLRPNISTFDFTYADRLAKFAKSHDMLLRGHTLVWHQNLPAWFQEEVNGSNVEQILQQHINTVVGRYAGKIHSWDVVNEAINVKDGRSDGLRQTPWLQLMGPDYLDFAFRAAAAADPKALLVYNEYGLDYDSRDDKAKRSAVLKLLEGLKSKGTPIHALGIQGHLNGAGNFLFNPRKFRSFLRDVASLGLKIIITELDVLDKDLPKNISKRDRIVAAAYEDYLSAALQEKAVIGVLTWGLSDRYTWLAEDNSSGERLSLPFSLRPLPLDVNGNRKLVWNAIARAFDQAPMRLPHSS
ncbi:endo-1,4-beta-xylanase [Anabaena sphaerica FACHB-251]|uniref:Beta-xylanase n=1 Tax=Anabaena sphaerica FACHB-251 TaxID=2692883 RepID=A0A926WK57_9NOST|nr:endo-1,4-beta-xylanase [Anabaena sphaerica]MBD2295932.1 endo-1,4-beta-xylanase [Anabaena sphaerica FACHB-251]